MRCCPLQSGSWSGHVSTMDYIRKFDIVLDKEHYYAGEKLRGNIVVENVENIKVRGKYNLQL